MVACRARRGRQTPDPGDGEHLELDVLLRVADQDIDHPGEVHHLRLGGDVLEELSEDAGSGHPGS